MIVDEPDRADGYEPFFGLREPPFSLSPNPRFRFASASHSAALAQAAAAIERREPLVVIIGDIGTGKTLLCRTMLQELRRRTFLSVVDDPMLGRDDLLEQLLQDFGIISKDRARLTPPSRHDLVDALQAFLRSLAPIGAHAVVIVDEAQHLQPEVLEQIRLLSNIDDERGTLLQVMLVGQTDLEALLARPDLRQLQQRVSRRIRLEPLKSDEVREYIEHRLALAGDEPSSSAPGAAVEDAAAAGPPGASVAFTPEAIEAVAQRSGGLPRVINLLCDRALEEAYQARVRTIDVPLIDAAAGALGLDAVPATAGAPALAEEPAGTTPKSSGFWGDAPIESDARAAHSEHEPEIARAGPDSRPAVSSRSAWYIALAAAGGAAAVAIWIGVHAMRTPATPAPPPAAAAAPVPTVPPRSIPQPDAAPPAEPPPPPAVPTDTPPSPSTAAAPAPRAATSANGRFEVVVGSFRTDARAAAVTAATGALALPVRRRVSNGWQQVIAGPFASRADAESAREKLNRAGLTGAAIVPIEP